MSSVTALSNDALGKLATVRIYVHVGIRSLRPLARHRKFASGHFAPSGRRRAPCARVTRCTIREKPHQYGGTASSGPVVANDPINGSDSSGLYGCTGTRSQCASVNQFVDSLNAALGSLDPKSDAFAKLSAVSQFIGSVGDRNGVTFNPTSLPKNTMANAMPGGTINIDLRQISSTAADIYAPANPSLSPSDLRNATGAGVVGHESRHELDEKRLWNGKTPPNRAAEYRTELNAYRTEQAVHQGLGFTTDLNRHGMTQAQSDQAVAAGAQASTELFCAEGGCP